MEVIDRDYSGFSVTMTNGSLSKQKLSNNVTIRVPSDVSDVEIKLTLRQARALRNALMNLDKE